MGEGEARQIEEVVVFDVNETLLDVSALRRDFEKLLPDVPLEVWFSGLLMNAMVATMTHAYESFDQQGVAALITLGARNGIGISESDATAFVEAMTELPPHPDVVPGMERLKSGGYRLAALTNSSSSFLRRQMFNSGLSRYFDLLISVDEVRRFKPAPETYLHAADRLDVPVSSMWMVAAHEWDITGAIRAGARGAFVDRGGFGTSRLSEPPGILARDLLEVAQCLDRLRP